MAKITRKGPGFGSLESKINELGKLKLIVGWFASAKYDENTSVAGVAAQNEYGFGHVPARPFIRPTMANNEKAWTKLLHQGSRAILLGNETADSFLEKFGLEVGGKIKHTITLIQSPPLADYTIEKRLEKMANGAVIGDLYKPLVETNTMINSITHEVQS